MEDLKKAIKELRKCKPRKFNQSLDLIVKLKNFKGKIDEVIFLPHPYGDVSICAFVDKDKVLEARKCCDEVISRDDFEKFERPRQIKELVRRHDFFIAEATIMPAVARKFGKYLAVKNKMPNPKYQIFTPKQSVEEMVEKLRKGVRIIVKKQPVISIRVGNEKMKDEELIENVRVALDEIARILPQGKGNIERVYLKFTMSKPVRIW